MQEKRAERIFDNDTFERHRKTVPEYEVAPEPKSYLDIGVRNIITAETARSRNIFVPQKQGYEYEVIPQAEPKREYMPAEEFDLLKFKPEAMPSEETMKILLSEKMSAQDAERMLSRSSAPSRRKTEETIIIDEIEEEAQSEKQAHITLNAKGKIAVAAYVAIILTMLIIALVTASSIATLSAQEDSLKAELRAVNTEVAALVATADALTDEALIELEANGLGMYLPTEQNGGIVTISLPSLKPQAVAQAPLNWFDALCKFIAGLFGR